MPGLNPGKAYRLFYPQMPMIICARHSGEVGAMAANSCIPLSDSPPLVGVAIKRSSRTDKILTKSNVFSVNWIDYRDFELMEKVALPFNERGDKLRKSGIRYRIERGAPIISRSRAHIICKLEKKIATGDHDFFLGRIVSASASGDFRDYWQFKAYSPLLYLGSDKKKRYSTI